MDRFFSLLRSGRFKVKFDLPVNSFWTDREIAAHILTLKCSNFHLTELPPLPLCTNLDCSNNLLTKLSSLPLCISLWCYCNRLTKLPPLPSCILLDCVINQLTVLFSLPLCLKLWCSENDLFSDDLDDWKIIWRLRKTLLDLLCVNLIR